MRRCSACDFEVDGTDAIARAQLSHHMAVEHGAGPGIWFTTGGAP